MPDRRSFSSQPMCVCRCHARLREPLRARDGTARGRGLEVCGRGVVSATRGPRGWCSSRAVSLNKVIPEGVQRRALPLGFSRLDTGRDEIIWRATTCFSRTLHEPCITSVLFRSLHPHVRAYIPRYTPFRRAVASRSQGWPLNRPLLPSPSSHDPLHGHGERDLEAPAGAQRATTSGSHPRRGWQRPVRRLQC